MHRYRNTKYSCLSQRCANRFISEYSHRQEDESFNLWFYLISTERVLPLKTYLSKLKISKIISTFEIIPIKRLQKI